MIEPGVDVTLFAAIAAMDIDALATRLAERVVMELPYAPPGYQRVHTGRDAVVRFMRGARQSFSDFAIDVERVLWIDGVMVAEYTSDGIAIPSGARYQNRYCTLLEFDEGGLITRWREYYDPTVVTGAFGPR